MARLLLTVAAAIATLALAATATGRGRCGDQACHADVSVSGHAEPQPIHRGETTELKITPKNDGPDGALHIDLHVDVPPRLRILEVRHYGGLRCRVKGSFVRCNLGDFANQQEAVV